MVGVRRETILFLEKGKYNPSLKLACKIALALQASIDEIFIFEEEDLKLDEAEIIVLAIISKSFQDYCC